VIAHRGASADLPENTLPAYALAVEQRADMIEIDLHRTADGAVVVAHDAELGGIGGSGEIADAPLAAIRALDAGGGEPVPTLDEVLDGFGAAVRFNLELKQSTRGRYEGMEAQALAAVEARDLVARTLFSSFYDPVLAALRAASAQARIALLLSRRFPHQALARAAGVGAEALNPEAGLVTPELVSDAHAEGLAVYPFTVDDPGDMRRMLDWGVDGLFTNVPARMRALLDGRPA
jgi:glycerophosphoryl diester phosphodiesterase